MRLGLRGRSGRSGDGGAAGRDRFWGVMKAAKGTGARAVIGTDGAVWNANGDFCALVGLDEPALRHLGWRQLVHSADRRYLAPHLVEGLAGGTSMREFEVRLLPPVRDAGGERAR